MIKEFQKEYRWLSNFAYCKIFYEGITYPSVENAYQAAKTINVEEREAIASATAGQAKRLGKTLTVREDWEDVKVQVMRELLTIKFCQTKYLGLLLATGNQHIQEGNYWNDKFWGVCLKTGEGENNLGKLIMDIREKTNEILGN